MGRYYYFDIETTGLDPVKDQVVTIQTQRLYPDGNAAGPLRIWTSRPVPHLDENGKLPGIPGDYRIYPHRDEATLINHFQRFLLPYNPWDFIPVGQNLPFEKSFMLEKVIAHVEQYSSYSIVCKRLFNQMPSIDIHPVIIIANRNRHKGTSLDKWSSKQVNGSQVPTWIKENDWPKLIDYIVEETAAFVELFRDLSLRLPRVVRPAGGFDA